MDEKPTYKKEYTFGWDFFKSLFKLIPLFYPKWMELSLLFTIITLICLILSEVVGYYIGLIPGKMYGSLYDKNEPRFWHLFWTGTLMYIAKCLLLALISFFSWLLYLSWRKNLVEALQKGYFSNKAYYRLNCVDSQGIDNADQRLTQDIERMCNQLATTVLPAGLIGPFVVVYYTVKTWKTAGPFGVGVIYLYFIVGTIMNKFLVSPLSKWSARVELNEGNFRYKQVTIRDNSEAIAFYRAEEFEDTMSKKTLYQLLNCQLRLMFWRFPSAFWMQFFDYYGGLLSYAIQYIPIFLMHSYDDSTDLVTIIAN
uniref:ABC transmembrane type-1 domain-containing protein n=1 Tax=Acrobeloides nanus TaxID=290746 RepID=A0A914CKQ8_9BILA